MDQPEDGPHRADALLLVSVWFEPEHHSGFRARLRTLGADGQMAVVGAASNRAKVTEMVGEWLDSLDSG